MARDWTWVLDAVALAAHAEQLAEHDGGDGIRDAGALASAMARPRNLSQCGDPKPDAAALAAAYAFGIARNHPFVDGNKRTAAVVAETFLALNSCQLQASDAELVVTIVALAAGDLSEDELTDRLRDHIVASAQR